MTTPPPPQEPDPGSETAGGSAHPDHTSSWYPPPAGAAPASGYAVPGWGSVPSAPTPIDDPLVPYDFSSLFERMGSILKRSWRSLLAIQAIGTLVPAAVMLVVVLATGVGGFLYANPAGYGTGQLTEEQLSELLSLFVGVSIVVVLVALASAYINAVAWAASIWTLTRQAAGEPAPLGEAFRYGFRRGLPLFGWNLLAGLCIAVGALCCILPGVYLGVALSLIAPIVVFEGGNAFSRSFRLTHSRFWPTAGRVVLLYLVYFGYSLVVSLPNNLAGVPTGDAAAQLALPMVMQLITTALVVPATVVLVVGLTVIYTELRSREQPLSTPQLAADLDHP